MTWIPTVSPSHIDHWNLCERKAAFHILDRSGYVQNIGAYRGDFGHKMLEAWGKDRTPPETMADEFALGVAMNYAADLDEKQISATDYAARLVATVNKMTPHYPEPPWPTIEQKFVVNIQGVNWAGRKDLEFSDSVWDHKFTSSLDYAKKSEDLPHDPQALSYAFEKFKREALSQVTVKLSYGLVSSKPRAWIVQHTFTPEQAAENIRPINEIGRKIIQLRRKRPDPLSLTPNWLACPHFGGCSFQHKCKPTVEQLTEAHAAMAMGEPPTKPKDLAKMSGLLSSLLPSGATPATASTTSQTAAVPGASSTPAPKSEGSDQARVVADCIRDATNLLRLGIARPEVVKALAGRYIGIAARVDSIVPAEAPPAETPATDSTLSGVTRAEVDAAAKLPAVNSGPPPGVAAQAAPEQPKAEEPAKAKSTRKAATKPEVEADIAVTIGELDTTIRELAKASRDTTLSLEVRANATLALANAVRVLAVPGPR